jgi:hypothetical protein
MMSRSPERSKNRIKTLVEKVELGKTTAEHAEEMIDFYKSWEQQRLELEETDEWKIDNMEYDLRSTQWIIDKVKGDDVYAQHLYAAMCNNSFIKNDVWPILTEKRWSCSWRSAGGIIADMQEKGDYMDWYCSGIRDSTELSAEEFRNLTAEQQDLYNQGKAFVSESQVTDEIREDLLKLGWIVKDDEDDKAY